MNTSNINFMKVALNEAKKAYKKMEVPVRSNYSKR